MTAPAPITFAHLTRLSDNRGLYEHAKLTRRREEHGYCTDDNARLLVVASRESETDVARRLSGLALDFVLDAQTDDGQSHNRMDRSGHWTDESSTEDCWGRSLWGLGTAVAHHHVPATRQRALEGFNRGARQRSRWPRAMAFAALGAADVLSRDGANAGARALLIDAIDVIGPIPTGEWTWPEPRLRYANATLAEAVIVAGATLNSKVDLDRGLTMLGWLLELETRRGHLSVTGVDGRGADDHGPQFDQQSIEPAAMADACWSACKVTGDHSWSRGVQAAAGWFAGANDTGQRMHDSVSGGGFDGLQPRGVNLNQGAESTLAFVSTMQRARSFATTP